MIGLPAYLFLSLALFGIGAFGFLARRNAIMMLICIELMLNAVNLSLVAFNAFDVTATDDAGAVFSLLIMAVAAAEATVGLALVIAIIRTRQTPEVDEYSDLKE
jgi:NADH-quinone oxidoreductase subunit K